MIEGKVIKNIGEKSPSSEETKHGKKTRDRKKHKKSETKSKKKKKRERREKRSQSNTPVESENNTLKLNETLIEDLSEILYKTEEMENVPSDQIDSIVDNLGGN